MPSDDQTRHTGDSSSDIFGQSDKDRGRSWPLPDSAVGMDSESPAAPRPDDHPPASDDPPRPMPGSMSPSFLEWAGAAETVDPEAETVDDEAPAVPLETPDPATARRGSGGSHSPHAASKHSLLVIALISYSSAATLALLYLFYALSQPRQHLLESLPDVPPLDVQNGEVMKLVPVDAELPAGHALALGESCRYGNLLVEPLSVVREPLEFDHFSGRAADAKPPTEPVLKLWVRFTNVSESQSIAPLDAELLFRRDVSDDGRQHANQFVRPDAGAPSPDAVVLMYDHPTSSEWDLRGQRLGQRLAPGESLETYLPSAAPASALNGPLVWRVHFRKGFSPRGFGVTTLIDVQFDSADVVTRTADETPTAG